MVTRLYRGGASRYLVTRADDGVGLDELFEVFSCVAVARGELGKAAGDRVGEFLEPVMWSESWFQVGGHTV